MRKENSAFRTKFISEAGSQLVNADYFAFVELDNYACYCIADGIDNDRMKESAKMAVTAVIDSFYQRPGFSKGLIRHYLEEAHRVLLKEAGTVRLEASVLVIVTDYKRLRWGNAGNARIYQWRNGKIIHKSKDQSLSQNMAEHGEIAIDKIEEHEERHNLYCYAGQRGKFKPDVSSKIKLADGDILSLMTCGIWENTGVPELLDSIEDAKAPEDVCTGIEEVILSQRLRNIQNYTFCCIYIDKVYKNPNRQRNMKIVKRLLIPLIIILFILTIGLTVKTVILYRNINSMWNFIDIGINDMSADMDLEGNNSYEKASKIYDGFDTRSELSKSKVVAAKPYMNLFEYRQTYIDSDSTCYDRYVAACKMLLCLVGKNGFERLENDKIDEKTLSLSSLKKLKETYLDKAAKSDLENFKKGLLDSFENLKVEYKVYMLMEDAKKLYSSDIEDKSKEQELVQAAVVDNIITYDFGETDFYQKYQALKTEVAKASAGNIVFDDDTNTDYNDFVANVNSKLQYIKGKAFEQQGKKNADNGQFEDAKAAYSNAKAAMEKAGSDAYAADISDLASKVDSVQQQITDESKDKLNEEASTLISQAAEKFGVQSYDEAERLCNEAKGRFNDGGISTGILYDSLTDLQTKITSAKEAASHEQSALTYEQQNDPDTAVSLYEEAKEDYSKAGMTDKENEMIQKISVLNKLISQKEKESEKAENINNERTAQ